MTRTGKPALLVVLLLGQLLVACGTETGAADTSAAPEPGCSQDVAPIEESKEFTAREERLSQRLLPPQPEPLIPLPEGVKPPVSESLDGLQARGRTRFGATVYLDEPVREVTYSQVWTRGGLVLEDLGTAAGHSYPERMKKDFGDRVVLTEVGPYIASVHWADPDTSGVRPHYVIWTDAKGRTFTLTGVRDAAEIVSIAREAVC